MAQRKEERVRMRNRKIGIEIMGVEIMGIEGMRNEIMKIGILRNKKSMITLGEIIRNEKLALKHGRTHGRN